MLIAFSFVREQEWPSLRKEVGIAMVIIASFRYSRLTLAERAADKDRSEGSVLPLVHTDRQEETGSQRALSPVVKRPV